MAGKYFSQQVRSNNIGIVPISSHNSAYLAVTYSLLLPSSHLLSVAVASLLDEKRHLLLSVHAHLGCVFLDGRIIVDTKGFSDGTAAGTCAVLSTRLIVPFSLMHLIAADNAQ